MPTDKERKEASSNEQSCLADTTHKIPLDTREWGSSSAGGRLTALVWPRLAIVVDRILEGRSCLEGVRGTYTRVERRSEGLPLWGGK